MKYVILFLLGFLAADSFIYRTRQFFTFMKRRKGSYYVLPGFVQLLDNAEAFDVNGKPTFIYQSATQKGKSEILRRLKDSTK